MTETEWTVEPDQRREIVAQIGRMNMLCISGGQWFPIADGIEMKAGGGYVVRVQLTPADDYTVTRIFRRNGVDTEHGQKRGVYFDTVGNEAYRASCFRSYDDEEW
jgi:hypothetical protein